MNAVMEQGKIDQVLSSKPDERRYLFEEAAGISRYRQRRRETESRLKRVEQDALRLDDVLVTGPDGCPCGSPFRVIDRVEGRADDVLLLPRAGTGDLEPFYADFVRGAVLGAGVADFRVVQTAPGTVRLAVLPPESHPQAADALRDAVGAAGLVPPAVEVAPWTDRAPLEKLRRVRRTFGAADTGGSSHRAGAAGPAQGAVSPPG